MIANSASSTMLNVHQHMVDRGMGAHLGINPKGSFFNSGRAWIAARVSFDPCNEEHKAAYISFIRTGRWGELQFIVEAPATDVVRTIERKLINQALGEEVYEFTAHAAC